MIDTHLSQDPVLKKVVEAYELPEDHIRPDAYLSLIRAIVGQQLSTKAAKTIYERFLNLFEEKYPDPETLLKMDIETLRTAGLSRNKAQYIKNIADFAINEGLQKEDLDHLSDEEAIKHLISIKGVGKWTVQMLLMFSLDRPDILPVDDLGIQQAMIGLYGIEEEGKSLKKKMLEIAEPWRPYRTTASRYLWIWKNNNPM